MDDKISKLILCFIPSNKCNLKCHYCFISHTNEWAREDIQFQYPASHMVKCMTKDRLGGTCLINLTAQGETLLYSEIVDLTKGLLRNGHYVELVTNLTISKRLEELLEIEPEYLKRLEFKISFHYKQLCEKSMLELFWNNVKKVQASACSYTLEIMPNDEIENCIPTICSECVKNVGAVCHATVGRTDSVGKKDLYTRHSATQYINQWKLLGSDMFDFKMKLYGVKRKEFCYAGKWSLLIDISSGEASQCYGRMNNQNIFKNPHKPIQFIPVGYSCTQPYCFNGHAHLALGVIPDLNTPTYFQIRNRVSENGNWIKEPCATFFKQKLYNNNKEYTCLQKIAHSIINPFRLTIWLFQDIPGTKRKLKKFLKIIRGKYIE